MDRIDLVMEDGTLVSEAPVNPLLEKWNKLYVKDDYGNECSPVLGDHDGYLVMNYSCVLCSSKNCYHSDYFNIPEDDKEIYDKWKNDLKEFYKQHSPNTYSMLVEMEVMESCNSKEEMK